MIAVVFAGGGGGTGSSAANGENFNFGLKGELSELHSDEPLISDWT